MSIRRPLFGLAVAILCSFNSSWHAQEPNSGEAPRALAYSAPLLKGARQQAMEVDAAGRIYVAGYICEPVLPVTANAAQRTFAGVCDGYVAILSPDRRLEYATYLGGAQQERISALDVDAAGNVYVAGDTGSANFPTTPGAFDVTFSTGGLDVFVTKISTTGAVAYSTLLGGSDFELPLGLTVDASNRAHVVGYTGSHDFPTTPGAVSRTHDPRDDAFYTRIDASGATVSYSTLIGGSGGEHAIEVALDSAGAAYIAGTTDSGDLPVTTAFQPSPGGESDGWLMKLAADGALRYLTYYGGSGNDSIHNVVVQGSSVFVSGSTCSANLPAAPLRPATCNAAFATKIAADGSAIQRTGVIEDLTAGALAVGPDNRAYVAGSPATTFSTTPDAFQPSPGPGGSVALVVVPLDSSTTPSVEYATYLGSAGPFVRTARSDGAGGVFVGGQFINDDEHSSFPVVNAPFSSVPAGGFVMHLVPASRMVNDVRGEIVMYARDVTATQGNWRLEQDPSAALGRRLRNPDGGAAKVTAASATPGDYVEFRFNAEAGVNYHLWMRGRADGDHWANDSVFVQFSDSVDAAGAPTWRIASTSATVVNLEDGTNAGVKGWGWQDNGYGPGVLGAHVRFATTGVHTMRVQRREDGYAFDQIVLSSSRYLTSSPGPLKEASTVLAHSNGEAAPPPPPPPATAEVVLHMTNAQTHGRWVKQARADAASGTVVRHPDAGAAKVVAMPVPPTNYFELSFDAEAGRAYRLWIRGIAEGDYWGNDSVHVQFSDSVDASGAARWRIGSGTSTEVNLEDCSGCGLRGWGWQDNGWGVGVAGPQIFFASTGRHVIRVTTREDGFSIDQIVLSPARYLTSSPGALKSDTTIVPKTQ